MIGARVVLALALLQGLCRGEELAVDAGGQVQTTERLLRIENDVGESASLFWKAPAGGEKHMGDVPPGQRFDVSTHAGHRFRVKGSSGKWLGDFVVGDARDIALSELGGAARKQAGSRTTWSEIIGAADPSPSAQMMQRVLDAAVPGTPRRTASQAMGVKFRSFLNFDVRIYWLDGSKAGVAQGHLRSNSETTTNSYIGHSFAFRSAGGETVATVTVRRDQVLYVIQDESSDAAVVARTEEQVAFMGEYLRKTGRHWVADYPKPPLELPLLPGVAVGHASPRNHSAGLFHCLPEDKRLPYDPSVHTDCAPEAPSAFALETLSLEPLVFQVEGFLSPTEARHLVDLATPRLKRSSVGNAKNDNGYVSKTRTSSTAWVSRRDSPVVDAIFRRAGAVLGLDEALLWGNGTGIAEDLQVVHYERGQEYTPHHDWDGTSKVTRYVTMLLYLNDQESDGAGGETRFPKARAGDGREGIQVRPKVGRAVIFYDQLADGNCDDFSLHAALPVRKGEKWLANFWIHNGPRNGRPAR